MDPRFVCQIKAAKKDETEVLIYDEIGKSFWGDGISAKELVQQLAGIDTKRIRVRINSGGGDVFEGLAIHNALRGHSAKVTTEIDSLAASIASIIALAGETVRMADNAFFMIHNPHGLAIGDADDMREMAALLDKVGGSLAKVYAEHSGQDEETVQAWMDDETWFTAEEAKEAGFVHALMKGKKVAASADLSVFRNVPDELRAAADLFNARKTDIKVPPAAGGAAPDDLPAPTPQAPAAQGDPMSAVDTAAQKNGAEAERKRSSGIRALVKEYREIAAIEQDMIDGWLDDAEITEEAVRVQILAQIKAKAKDAPHVSVTGVKARADKDPKRGFENHVEFFTAVIKNRGHTSREQVKDERLRPLAAFDEKDDQAGGELAFLMPRAFNPKSIRAAAGSDEQGVYSDPHGGFAVPESTLPGLLAVGFEGDPTVGRTMSIPMATPTVRIIARTDKDHSTSVSGGFTVARRPETVDFVSSRANIERVTLQASSLVGLAYETEELIQDSAISFAALIDAGFRDQFAAHMLNEKIRGNGPGEYEGVLNAAAKVEISKETNQTADTIVYANVLKMRARCWGYGQAIWLANHDCLPTLAQMSLAIGTAGSAVYVPGTFGQSPDTLLGRPIFYSEYPATVGDAGDLILWNPTQYLEGLYQPLQSAESVHVRFVQHERVFKLWLRNAGASWWRSALTPAKGTNTLSPILTLAARA